MLFGLSAADRAELRGRHPAVSKRIERLTKDEPRLLVSILMGNTIINCLFFVITSAILLQADLGAAWSAGVATGLLLILVVVGEIIPKALCDVARVSAASRVPKQNKILMPVVGPCAPSWNKQPPIGFCKAVKPKCFPNSCPCPPVACGMP